jgi:Virulence-associated protein E/Bifunctional DNA primase/polymerase, N-terminal/Primase C terminal 2 (PriCT-2)
MASQSLRQALSEGLRIIPNSWQLTPVGANKQPILDDWQNAKTPRDELHKLIQQGRAKGYGLVLGEISSHNDQSSLLAVDFDGPGTDELAIELNDRQPLADTVAWTSGREGRHQRLYCVPLDYHGELIGHAEFAAESGAKLELRYNGHQSVLPPSQHPETGRYQWLTPPAEFEAWDKLTHTKIPYAPQWMIDALLIDRRAPEQISSGSNPESDRAWAIEYMSAIQHYPSDDYTDWIRVGMALKSIGDDLFCLWDSWSATSDKYDGGKIQRRWDGFKPRHNGIKVLAWFAKKAGWTPAPRAEQVAERNGKAAHAPKVRAEMFDEIPSEAPQLPAKVAKNSSSKSKSSPRFLMTEFLPMQPELATLRFNEMAQEPELHGRILEESKIKQLRIDMERRHGKNGDIQRLDPYSDYFDCLLYVARQNSYHPVHDYLRAVEAVNKDRIDSGFFIELLRRIGVVDLESGLYSELLKRALVGAVRRVFEPGTEHQWALVFQGRQGSGKSTFWKILGGSWFTDAITDVKGKDEFMKLAGKWIVELAEIEQITNKKEDGAIKAFISRTDDVYRGPWEAKMGTHRRAFILVGTVNQVNFLKDPTGSRRYGIIPNVNQVDIAWVRANRDLIWTAAFGLYRQGYRSDLSDLEAESQDNNKSFQNDDPWAEGILEWASKRVDFTVEDILREHLLIDQDRWTRRDQMAIASVLKQAGYKKQRKKIGGMQSMRWNIGSGAHLAYGAHGGHTPPNSCPESEGHTLHTAPLLLLEKEREGRCTPDTGENCYEEVYKTKSTFFEKDREICDQYVQRVQGPLFSKGLEVCAPDEKVCPPPKGMHPPTKGKRYFVRSVSAVGTCADVDEEYELPVRIDFDLYMPAVQEGRLNLSQRFAIEDLEEVEK